MSDLVDLQRQFLRALNEDAGALDGVVVDAARRMTVHKTTIEGGLFNTLANGFPALRRVVGGPVFASLVSEFIATAPPRHPLLSTYGRGFPAFVATHPIAASLPYLQDLARVEWARQDSYLAADAALLDPGSLNTGGPDSLSRLTLRLHPATRVITSPFPVHTIWRLNQADVDDKDIPALDMKVTEHVIVTRPHGEVVTRAISLADAALVTAVMGGASLGAAVEGAFAVAPDFDVTQVLAGHFANGTFASPC
jgi:hypothetical protein